MSIPGLALGLALLAVAGQAAENSSSASVGGRWLNLLKDPRAAAIGGAGAASAQGAGALGLNPAQLAGLKGIEAAFSTQQWVEDLRLQRLALATEAWNGSAFGLNLDYLDLGAVERFEVVNGAPVSLGDYRPNAIDGGLAFAQHLGADWSLGAALNVVTQDLGKERSLAVAADLGLAWQALAPLRVGFSVLSLGSALDGYRLPLKARLGAAYDLPLGAEQGLLLAADLLASPESDETAAALAGAEFRLQDTIFLRGGYRMGASASPGGPSAGLGLQVSFLRVDYSYAVLGPVASQQIALTVLSAPRRKAPPRPVFSAEAAPEAAAEEALPAQLQTLMKAVDEGDTLTARRSMDKLIQKTPAKRREGASVLKDAVVEDKLYEGELEESEKYLRLMVEMDRTNAYNYMALGSVCWQRGKAEEAILNLKKAYALDPALEFLPAQIQRMEAAP